MEQGPVVATPQPMAFDWKLWINIICSQTGTNQKDIPKEVVEVLATSPTKNDFNRMFFMWHEAFNKPKPLEFTEDEARLFEGVISVRNLPEYVHAKNDMDSSIRSITAKHRDITALLERVMANKMILMRLENNMELKLLDIIKDCVADGWYKLNKDDTLFSLPSQYPVIYFTTPMISLKYYNPQAKIDKNVPMGEYRVLWYVREGRIRVDGSDNTMEINDYIHPHVSSDGSVCWGNASQVYAESMRDMNPKNALEALRVILQNYNADSPYQGIEKWEEYIEANPHHGKKVEYIPFGRKAWIESDYMPSQWAKTYQHDYREAYDEDEDFHRNMYLMTVFRRVYEGTLEVAGDDDLYYIRTSNGRNYSIDECDIWEWED